MKILTILGARPQFVKAAAVSQAIDAAAEAGGAIVEEIIHTGQHFDTNMSDIFFKELGLRAPAAHLGVRGGSHGLATGRMLEAVEAEIIARKPDMVLVYGDTNSTLAGALAAAKLHIPVAHVEAGLRSFNKAMPEEINRVLTDHVSTLLFCPSERSVEQLASEGIRDGVHATGDIMYDVFKAVAATVESPSVAEPYVLMTLHRAELTDEPEVLRDVIATIGAKAGRVIFPVHPRTRAVMEKHAIATPGSIELIDPIGYKDLVQLLMGSAFVATDSGGLQKEAFFAGKPCLTLRAETEWTELVDVGANRLCPPRGGDLEAGLAWARAAKVPDQDVYGRGDAAERIVTVLRAFR
jgi:UDP-GlcNAc3NAcA epimerase